jgi:uncharacterized phage protein (TIGR02218 family)
MTPFDTYEKSVESSQPLELYTITLGLTTWRYVAGDQAYTIGGDTFEPLAITREALNQSKEEDQQLTITLPAMTDICRQYISTVPGQGASVKVERVQKPDGIDRIIVFVGSLLTVTFEESGKLARLTVQAQNKAMSRTIPRNVYSSICNHVLYDPRCTIDRTLFRITGEVLLEDVAARTIQVNGADGQADGYYQAGYVESTSATAPDRRLILAHVGEVLTLNLAFGHSLLGQNVRVYAGCKHDAPTCKSKFNNLPNFGGYPFVPTTNIFSTGLK